MLIYLIMALFCAIGLLIDSWRTGEFEIMVIPWAVGFGLIWPALAIAAVWVAAHRIRDKWDGGNA